MAMDPLTRRASLAPRAEFREAVRAMLERDVLVWECRGNAEHRALQAIVHRENLDDEQAYRAFWDRERGNLFVLRIR